MTTEFFNNCMEACGVDLEDARLKKIVDDIGSKTGLNEGLNIAMGIILNYDFGGATSNEIVEKIKMELKR